MLLHDGDVDGITSRKTTMAQHDLLCSFDGDPVNGQHLVNYTKQCVKSCLYSVPAVNRNVTVQDFL